MQDIYASNPVASTANYANYEEGDDDNELTTTMMIMNWWWYWCWIHIDDADAAADDVFVMIVKKGIVLTIALMKLWTWYAF